jgi:hypothetical protein
MDVATTSEIVVIVDVMKDEMAWVCNTYESIRKSPDIHWIGN